MNENTGAAHPRPLARRIAERRLQLGLSENALATRAGMSPRCPRQLIEVGPDFDPGGLVRIAASLGLTYQELSEGRADPPPGQTGPGPPPVLARLTTAECWDRLGPHGLGRIALAAGPGPAVFPVNYAVDAGTVVYHTATEGACAPEAGAAVAFEVDLVDDQNSAGWSVLISGTAERVEGPAAIRHLAERHAAEPWAGGDRPLWIRIRPDTVTGRRTKTI